MIAGQPGAYDQTVVEVTANLSIDCPESGQQLSSSVVRFLQGPEFFHHLRMHTTILLPQRARGFVSDFQLLADLGQLDFPA